MSATLLVPSFSIAVQLTDAPSRFLLDRVYDSVVNDCCDKTLRVQSRNAGPKVPHSLPDLLVLLRVRDADHLLSVQRSITHFNKFLEIKSDLRVEGLLRLQTALAVVGARLTQLLLPVHHQLPQAD